MQQWEDAVIEQYVNHNPRWAVLLFPWSCYEKCMDLGAELEETAALCGSLISLDVCSTCVHRNWQNEGHPSLKRTHPQRRSNRTVAPLCGEQIHEICFAVSEYSGKSLVLYLSYPERKAQHCKLLTKKRNVKLVQKMKENLIWNELLYIRCLMIWMVWVFSVKYMFLIYFTYKVITFWDCSPVFPGAPAESSANDCHALTIFKKCDEESQWQ